MTFSKSPPPLPLLGTEINEHKGITIGRNMLQTCAEGKQLLKVDVYVKAEEEDRFFVELCNIRTKFTYVIISKRNLRYKFCQKNTGNWSIKHKIFIIHPNLFYRLQSRPLPK